MRKILTVSSLALALTLAGCGDSEATSPQLSGEPIETVSAPQGQEWSQVVAKSDVNGYVMGNPDAPVKLVEYGAITCPGCAQFHKDSEADIKQMVDSGRVSFEFRPFLVHGIQDLPGFLLAQCNGPEAFFGLAGRLYDDQQVWLGKLSGLTPAEEAAFEAAQPAGKINIIADKMELVDFVKPLGVSEDAARSCLSDKQAMDELVALTEKTSNEGVVRGTPTLLVNGKVVDGANWNPVKSAIEAAGAR